MKQSAWPFALLAAAAVAFSSCVASRQVSFNEADFARTTGTGSGSVTGHASVTFSWQDWTGPQTTTRTADSETVVLLPVNAYTTESIQRKYIAGVNLADGDPRYCKVYPLHVNGRPGELRVPPDSPRGVLCGKHRKLEFSLLVD